MRNELAEKYAGTIVSFFHGKVIGYGRLNFDGDDHTYSIVLRDGDTWCEIRFMANDIARTHVSISSGGRILTLHID